VYFSSCSNVWCYQLVPYPLLRKQDDSDRPMVHLPRQAPGPTFKSLRHLQWARGPLSMPRDRTTLGIQPCHQLRTWQDEEPGLMHLYKFCLSPDHPRCQLQSPPCASLAPWSGPYRHLGLVPPHGRHSYAWHPIVCMAWARCLQRFGGSGSIRQHRVKLAQCSDGYAKTSCGSLNTVTI
jgi:hypothetical protein